MKQDKLIAAWENRLVQEAADTICLGLSGASPVALGCVSLLMSGFVASILQKGSIRQKGLIAVVTGSGDVESVSYAITMGTSRPISTRSAEKK